MVDITVDEAGPGHRKVHRTGAWRLLAILLLLGSLSFAASDQLVLPRDASDPPNQQGRPFTLGVSALGGPDCLGGCLPSPDDREGLSR
jgi:hypothetical protein